MPLSAEVSPPKVSPSERSITEVHFCKGDPRLGENSGSAEGANTLWRSALDDDALVLRELVLSAGHDESLLVTGALRCFSRWGISKISLEDIAREAGTSRATLYRMFPGGKEQLFFAVVVHELARLRAELVRDATLRQSPHEFLAGAIWTANCFLNGHEVLAFLQLHEPGVVLDAVSFGAFGRMLAVTEAAIGDVFEDHLGLLGGPALEWALRVLLTYSWSPAEWLELSNFDSVCSFVEQTYSFNQPIHKP